MDKDNELVEAMQLIGDWLRRRNIRLDHVRVCLRFDETCDADRARAAFIAGPNHATTEIAPNPDEYRVCGVPMRFESSNRRKGPL